MCRAEHPSVQSNSPLFFVVVFSCVLVPSDPLWSWGGVISHDSLGLTRLADINMLTCCFQPSVSVLLILFDTMMKPVSPGFT